ncbi:hypothetical protein HDV00_006066 [Rhizophlyctis rosea]|nr:hypothetical protein HDV00_006066 [Rhizophlyctis rosea]
MLANNPATRAQNPFSGLTAASSLFRCSCYGWCNDDVKDKLLERLIGLTGDVEFTWSENLAEHEIVYGPAEETPAGPARRRDVVLRLRADVVEDGKFLSLRQRHWQLSYHGAPEPRLNDKQIVVQRIVHEAPLDGDVFSYMEILGYKPIHEYTRRGYRFTYRGVNITITRAYELTEQHKVSSSKLLDVFDNIWAVELSSPRVRQEHALRMWDELHALAGHLEGLVRIVQVEEGMLQNRIFYPSDEG